MKFIAFLIALAAATAANAQPAPSPGPGPVPGVTAQTPLQNNHCVVGAGGTQTRDSGIDCSGGSGAFMPTTGQGATAGAAAQIAANGGQFYSPITYGAKCDSNGTTGTDDSAAINAMFAAIRTANKSFTVTSPLNKTCFIASSINVTEFNSIGQGSSINLRLDCATNGTPCVDALGSRWINWEYLYLNGELTNSPSYGIQIGRTTGANADLHFFHRPYINGYFTKAAYYNFASETVTVMDPFIVNYYPGSAEYGMVQDGYNHFNITSAFTTVTAPVDTPQSFNENTIIGGWIQGGAAGGGSAIWLGATGRHKFIGSYCLSTAPYIVTSYQVGSVGNTDFDFDCHVETSPYITDVFFLTGPQATPSLYGLHYRDQNSEASNSVFKADTGITNASSQGADVRVYAFSAGSGVKLFDNASLWNFSGHLELPAAGNYTAPLILAGADICIAGVCTYNWGIPNNSYLQGKTTGGGLQNLIGVDAANRTNLFATSSGYGFFNGNYKLLGIDSVVSLLSTGVWGWSASSSVNNGTLDSGISRSAANEVAVGNGTSGDATGALKATSYKAVCTTFSAKPAAPVAGQMACFTDSNTATWGATIAGSGSNNVQARYNGTNWTVTGI